MDATDTTFIKTLINDTVLSVIYYTVSKKTAP